MSTREEVMPPSSTVSTLDVKDYLVVLTFIVGTLTLPFYIGYKKRHGGFFALTFAGRELGFWSMALTMFLSEKGSAQLTGLAGWAVQSGLGIYGYELVGGLGLLTLGWLFMPVYMASGVLTTIDYANKRFGGKRIGIVMVLLMLVINLISKFSVELHTTHVMIDQLFPIPQTLINVCLLIGALVVVSPGGLYTLVYTNNVQFLFFLVGMPVIFVFSYQKFDSWREIHYRYQKSWPSSTIKHITNGSSYKYTHCGIPDISSLDLIRTHNDRELPWPGMVFGIYIISIYKFCIDHSILQFCLGAVNLVHAKYACIIHGLFKITTIFLVIPGFIARVLYTDIVACADPDICERTCGKRSGCADLALPQLFENVVPEGWRGVVLTAFMAATLTSLAATLHSGSTIFVINLYRPLRPEACEGECIMVGKVVVLLQAVMGMVLVDIVDKIPHMHDFMRQIYSSLTPPLVAVYVTGIFWERVTETIAFRTLVLGTSISCIRLCWKFSYGIIPCGDESENGVPDIIANFHDLHFAIFLFVICTSHIFISGLKRDAIETVRLYRLIYWLRYDTRTRIHIDDVKFLSTTMRKSLLDAIFRENAFVKMVRSSLAAWKHNAVQKQVKTVRPDKNTFRETSLDMFEKDDNDDADDADDGFEIKEKKEEKEEKEVASQKKKITHWACMSWSTEPMSDDILHNSRFARTLERERPSETKALNALVIILMLAIVFIMGFFA